MLGITMVMMAESVINTFELSVLLLFMEQTMHAWMLKYIDLW